LNQYCAQFRGAIYRERQSSVDPLNDIAIGNIADEKEQAVGSLIEPSVTKVVTGQGASSKIRHTIAATLILFVPAAKKVPMIE
jgi:hypothetical protein